MVFIYYLGMEYKYAFISEIFFVALHPIYIYLFVGREFFLPAAVLYDLLQFIGLPHYAWSYSLSFNSAAVWLVIL